jgi:chemosensory pili system protein ChpA (sensor histidine kinase/response regulator)
MMLEGTHCGATIGWVREDLDECLDSVRENLESYADDPSNRRPLAAVQDELERLNLVFRTMQQEGAVLLTDEMIAVGGHMLHSGQSELSESLNALTDAFVVLPAYLDRLQAGHEDLPILLLPTLNELRASYDESLMSEGTLFSPRLDVIIPELSGSEADAVPASDLLAFARRVRSLYQGALLGWLKEQSKSDLLGPMQSVCRKLYVRLGRNELRRLWWIADLAMQGLRDGSIDNDLPLRRLFARLDLTLKAMTEGGEQGPSGETITALSRALLFYAAQARPGSKATDTLRERFGLEELIPDREALLRARGAVTGRDAGLFQSIGDAIKEELGQVKDTLDMELRTGRIDTEQRTASRDSLRQLADTLGMLNLPVPARAVEELLPSLEAGDETANLDLDSPLLGLAQKLLEVESILETHIRLLGEPVEDQAGDGATGLSAQEQRQIASRMLDECVINLRSVQDAVRARLEGEEADFATPLRQIAGALRISAQDEVAFLVQKLERTLNAGLPGEASGDGPDAESLEALTDSVAALELFLTGSRDGQADSLRYLEIMQARLDGLPEAGADGQIVPDTEIVLPEPEVEAPAAAAVPQDRPVHRDPACIPYAQGQRKDGRRHRDRRPGLARGRPSEQAARGTRQLQQGARRTDDSGRGGARPAGGAAACPSIGAGRRRRQGHRGLRAHAGLGRFARPRRAHVGTARIRHRVARAGPCHRNRHGTADSGGDRSGPCCRRCSGTSLHARCRECSGPRGHRSDAAAADGRRDPGLCFRAGAIHRGPGGRRESERQPGAVANGPLADRHPGHGSPGAGGRTRQGAGELPSRSPEQ